MPGIRGRTFEPAVILPQPLPGGLDPAGEIERLCEPGPARVACRLQLHRGLQVPLRRFVVSQLQQGVPPQTVEGPVLRGLGDRPRKPLDGRLRLLLEQEYAAERLIQPGIGGLRTGGFGREQHALGSLKNRRGLPAVPLLFFELLSLGV